MTALKTRGRVFLLVILAALPALLATAYSAIERRAAAESKAREQLQRLVKRPEPGGSVGPRRQGTTDHAVVSVTILWWLPDQGSNLGPAD